MNKTIKAIKGFNSDMTCRGFQYEIGKTYDPAKKYSYPIFTGRDRHPALRLQKGGAE